jgi:hypothetical protein
VIDPIHILRLESMGFLCLLAATLVYRMLTGRMNLSRLLARKNGSAGVSPERVQLLMATLALSAEYIREVIHSTNGTLPDVSAHWLYVFGASSGIYASVKAYATLKSK